MKKKGEGEKEDGFGCIPIFVGWSGHKPGQTTVGGDSPAISLEKGKREKMAFYAIQQLIPSGVSFFITKLKQLFFRAFLRQKIKLPYSLH